MGGQWNHTRELAVGDESCSKLGCSAITNCEQSIVTSPVEYINYPRNPPISHRTPLPAQGQLTGENIPNFLDLFCAAVGHSH